MISYIVISARPGGGIHRSEHATIVAARVHARQSAHDRGLGTTATVHEAGVGLLGAGRLLFVYRNETGGLPLAEARA